MSQVESSNLSAKSLLNAEDAVKLLRQQKNIHWPGQSEPKDLLIERAWPNRRGGFSVEWSIDLNGSRCSLYAQQLGADKTIELPAAYHPNMNGNGLRNLLLHLEDQQLLIHSLDCDPDLPHLPNCLDADIMQAQLAPHWSKTSDTSSPAGPLTCKPLGYRSGRRATFVYGAKHKDDLSGKLVGKTFHDNRGEDLLERHSIIHDKLHVISKGRVQVPKPIGYLPDLRMALFSWCPDQSTDRNPMLLPEIASVAGEALSDLHRVKMDGLPEYTLTSELAVANRWLKAMYSFDPCLAVRAAQLVDGLHQVAMSVNSVSRCTIHRDYYERQLTCSKQHITLLDLDTLAIGDPSLDWGNLLAHLLLLTIERKGSTADLMSCVAEKLIDYQQRAGELDFMALIFYWASALFRIGAVHAFRCTTKVHTPALWVLAGRLLQTGYTFEAAGGADHHELETLKLEPILEAIPS